MEGLERVGFESYREYAAPGCRHVACTWTRSGIGNDPVVVVPDGCVDLIWRSDGQLLVAGADTSPKHHSVEPGLALVGARLRPGTAGAVLGVPMPELVDRLIAIEDCWGRSARAVAERLRRCASTLEQRELLARLVEVRAAEARVDLAVIAASEALTNGQHTTASLARFAGIKSRQFRRRFAHQVGYGPKTFERIARLRRARAVLERSPGLRLAEVAAVRRVRRSGTSGSRFSCLLRTCAVEVDDDLDAVTVSFKTTGSPSSTLG